MSGQVDTNHVSDSVDAQGNGSVGQTNEGARRRLNIANPGQGVSDMQERGISDHMTREDSFYPSDDNYGLFEQVGRIKILKVKLIYSWHWMFVCWLGVV